LCNLSLNLGNGYLVISVSQLLYAASDAFSVIQRTGRDAFEISFDCIPSLLVVMAYVAVRAGDVEFTGTVGRGVRHYLPKQWCQLMHIF
jgi:hypothetical protein